MKLGDKDFIVVDSRETFTLSGDVTREVRLAIDVDKIHSGLIADLGTYCFSVLICIASFVGTSGKAFPSQEKISELTGISLSKVKRCVLELSEMTIDDRPIFTRTYAKGAKGKRTIYNFNNGKVSNDEILARIAVESQKEDLPVKTTENNVLTPKDVIVAFCEQYMTTFGDGYIVSWARDVKLVKEKLLPNIPVEDIPYLIEIAVGMYPELWGNAKYPRPTVSMLCGWLGQRAYAIVLDEKKDRKAFEDRVATEEQANNEMERFMQL